MRARRCSERTADTPREYRQTTRRRISQAIDTVEHMFEYGSMTQAAATLDEDSPVVPDSATAMSAASTIGQLQQRIRSMQATKLDSRLIPTHPALADLLPGGGLKQGAVYSVEPAANGYGATLLLALLAGPSAAGSWCGVVGVPEFGIEAAASFGIDLERLVLVPNPGDQWLAVTAAIADVMTVVVTKPPRAASEGNLARLTARLRQRGSTLIVVGSHSAWSQSEAMLSLSQSSWSGIGDGYGHLSARQVTVTVSQRAGGRPRSARMWLPDPELQFARIGTSPVSTGSTREAVSTGSTREAVPERGGLRAVG
jgi:hypothetical protein